MRLPPGLVNVAIDYVEERKDGMSKCHLRTGVSHYFLDSFSHAGFIAMNNALGTSRLVSAKRALVQPKKRITLHISALIAEAGCSAVNVVAMELNHRTDSLLFALEPRKQFAGHNPYRPFLRTKVRLD